MTSRFDYRNHPEVQRLLKELSLQLRYTPLVNVPDLSEVLKVFRSLPKLEFPINSAGELMEKLHGGKTLDIAEVKVDPFRMIKYMPAYYFPITTGENFVEKMAELIRSNRRQVDVPQELENIKQQLPTLQYPIANAEALLKAIGTTRVYRYNGRNINPIEMVKLLPRDFFPVQSAADFHSKIEQQLQIVRPLIVKD